MSLLSICGKRLGYRNLQLRCRVGNLQGDNLGIRDHSTLTSALARRPQPGKRGFHNVMKPRNPEIKQTYYRFCGPASVCLIGNVWAQLSPSTSCEEATYISQQPRSILQDKSASMSVHSSGRWREIRHKAVKALRLFARAVKLMVALAPVMAIYPIHRLLRKDADKDAQDVVLESFEHEEHKALGLYLKLCLRCVEWSGAAIVKLMQWASSRPDFFGNDFCAVFSSLQDDTTPHSIKHTERVLREAYGDDWKEHLRLEKIVGSGCIGQVYKGTVVNLDGSEREVAVKVRHPSVTAAIDDDLDLLRLAVRLLGKLPFDAFKNLRWLNPEGVVEEFADLLKLQLDFRNEADHLVRFNKNFRNNPDVLFPELVKGYEPHPEVLVETFCEGQPVLQFVKEYKDDRELLSEMCYLAVKAVCQMLFVDNFMHGDLHPGNVFISSKSRKFILLDVGIVTEYNDDDHDVIVNVLASFIRCNGREAGRYLIDNSNERMKSQGELAVDEDAYLDKIEALTLKASRGENYFMEHLGTYISYICECAAKHHVMMNHSFVSASLSVKVMEGIALALDPSVEIWRVANPIILESEMKRRWSRASSELISLVTGGRKAVAHIVGLESE